MLQRKYKNYNVNNNNNYSKKVYNFYITYTLTLDYTGTSKIYKHFKIVLMI